MPLAIFFVIATLRFANLQLDMQYDVGKMLTLVALNKNAVIYLSCFVVSLVYLCVFTKIHNKWSKLNQLSDKYYFLNKPIFYDKKDIFSALYFE